MRNVIYKYEVPLQDQSFLMLPKGATILSVGEQGDHIFLWAMVDADEIDKVRVNLAVVGTGNPMPASLKPDQFLGSVQLHRGRLVFHVFAWY